MDVPCKNCEDGRDWIIESGKPSPCVDCLKPYQFREEMRRYLYRNVACEFRKGFADFLKMPDLPGWA